MKRTTNLVEEDVVEALQALARGRGVLLAHVTREALAAYVAGRNGRRRPLTLVAVGRSGRREIAERFEELLKGGFGR